MEGYKACKIHASEWKELGEKARDRMTESEIYCKRNRGGVEMEECWRNVGVGAGVMIEKQSQGSRRKTDVEKLRREDGNKVRVMIMR